MKHLVRWCVLALVTAMAGCAPREEPKETVSGGESRPSAEFRIPATGGGEGEITLSSYKGKVVLLDFWATWCPPCRYELPHLNQLQAEFKDKGFSVVGLSVDQGDPAEIAEAIKRMGLQYPVGLAGPEVQAAYGGIRAIPTKFLLDKTGAIRKHYLGVVDPEQLRADINALLAM